jgi:hypothetical protein
MTQSSIHGIGPFCGGGGSLPTRHVRDSVLP